LHLLDVQSGELLAQSAELDTIVWDLAYSPRGDFIATAMNDNSVTLWDAEDLSVLEVLQHDGAVNSVAFSPDGELLAAGVATSEGGVVQIWNLADRTILHRFWAHAYSVPAMSFSPNGQFLGTGAIDRTVKVWQVSNGQLVRALPQDGQGISLAFSSDSSQLATAMCALSDANANCLRGEVWLWRVSDWERMHVLGGPLDWVESVTFSPAMDLVVGGGRDFGVYIWDSSDGRLLRMLIGHQGPVEALGFSSDGRFLATGSSDQTVILWEISP
jgi:WD40 repeat protein